MIRVTVEEAQENLEFLMNLVERGETILIEAEKGNVIMAPVAKSTITPEVDKALAEEEKAMGYGPSSIPGMENLPSPAELASFVAEQTIQAHKNL